MKKTFVYITVVIAQQASGILAYNGDLLIALLLGIPSATLLLVSLKD